MYTWKYERNRDFFPECFYFSPPVAGLFSPARVRGMQAARVCARAQVWVPARLRGGCSRRAKLRNLASKGGEGFHPARARQAHGNLELSLFLFFTALLLLLAACCFFWSIPVGSHGRYHSSASSFLLCVNHERCCCACVWERSCACVRVLQQ